MTLVRNALIVFFFNLVFEAQTIKFMNLHFFVVAVEGDKRPAKGLRSNNGMPLVIIQRIMFRVNLEAATKFDD